jgi:hypothetical protein
LPPTRLFLVARLLRLYIPPLSEIGVKVHKRTQRFAHIRARCVCCNEVAPVGEVVNIDINSPSTRCIPPSLRRDSNASPIRCCARKLAIDKPGCPSQRTQSVHRRCVRLPRPPEKAAASQGRSEMLQSSSPILREPIHWNLQLGQLAATFPPVLRNRACAVSYQLEAL